MSTPATEATIVEALRKLHPAPEWAFLPGCGNGTGGRRERAADALAMSLWPSRGIEIHGFEVKSHRGDWLRERKDPEKAEEIAQRCHRWSLVVADEKVAPLGEVPPAWGLWVMEGRKLRVARPATLREPKPLTWSFLAALLRTSAKGTEALLSASVPRSEVDEKVEARVQAEAGHEVKLLRSEVQRMKDAIVAFEQASGVTTVAWRHPWDAKQVGEAVRLLIESGGPRGVGDRLRRSASTARFEARALDAIAQQAETAAAGLCEETAA
jgi:hypothetical protein